MLFLQFGALTQPRVALASPMMPLPNSATTGFLRITMHRHNLVFTQAHRTSIRPHECPGADSNTTVRAYAPTACTATKRRFHCTIIFRHQTHWNSCDDSQLQALGSSARPKGTYTAIHCWKTGERDPGSFATSPPHKIRAVWTPGTVLFERIVATSSCVGNQGKMGRGEHTQNQERREGRTICEQLHCSPRSSTRATDCKFLGVVEATWMFAP